MSEWRQRARCRGEPNIDFYTDDGDEQRLAVQFCEECPVRLDCLTAGMDEKFGVWGGKATAQREQEAND